MVDHQSKGTPLLQQTRMETDASSLEPTQADAKRKETTTDTGNVAPVDSMANESQPIEQMCCSENGGCDLSSTARDRSQPLQQESEAVLGLASPSFHEDMHGLSPSATPDDSQFGSKGSSVQDMGSYFSPRIPDHSSSTNDMALPQTPPTPLTELREWPPESKLHHDNIAGDALVHDQRRIQAGCNPEPLEAAEQVAPEPKWRDSATQTVIGPSTTRVAATRPTSIPILTTKTASKRRRDGPEYPVYPDQSFAALQSQQHVIPYQPHPLRTRSSHPSQNSSFSSISSRQSRDFTMQPGAKTTGNTPAQSPGLFSPTMPRGRPDDPTRTPTLHPSHLQTPTETHKLLKDIDPVSGRKLINDYELIEKLGSGQHGTVKLGKNLQSGDLVAVKIVRRFSKKLRLGRTGDPSDMIKKEVAILKKARHGNVVSLLEVIDDDEFEKVYLVLEYVTRGEIVWRKWADKDVAVFEMNRVKREKANQTDESFEHEEVDRFNQTVTTRRAERHQALQKHRIPSFWNLQASGEPEEDVQMHGLQRERFPSSTSFSSSDQLMTVVKLEMSGEEATPKESDIPRSVPQHATPKPVATEPEVGEATSDPKLDSPAQPEDTICGASDLGDNASDVALNSKLEQIFYMQTHWSEEEEEYQHVPCLTLSQALDAFRDTVLGLEYLHYQGIIHRDIKPANLLWTSDFRVKISDFGVSYLGKPMREDDEHAEIPEADAAIQNEAIELAKTVGTPAFYAPELCDPELFDLEKNPHRPQITGQIDVWALGVTLYCMIFGRLPFIDQNEMAMYEKIAREEVFISKLRLKGVEKSDDKVTTNIHKRVEDVVEYEAVDDELRDLLRRLLEKNPLKRISLKEVKHHPWVLRGIQDQGAWVDETDPSVQSEGKKIEVSNEDVQYAVVGLVDRLKSAFRRVGSVVRGREGRKRTDSGAKAPDSPSSGPLSKGSQEGRRSSLRGDEFTNALRASREGSEHPLSQSVSASPEVKVQSSYFGGEDQAANQTFTEPSSAARPNLPERTLSNAESTRTIRPAVPLSGRDDTSSPPFSSLTTVVDDSSSSSLGGIFGGAGRRFVNSMRSRERERRRDSPSQSSRSSSAGGSSLNVEDPHASPSIAFSSAVAAGRVDQPPVLREPSPAPLLSAPKSTRSGRTGTLSDAYEQAQEQNYRRQILEASREGQNYPGTGATASDTPCPPSPDDAFFSNVGVSSSSDQVGSAISESFSHPSVPSIVSGASSVSGSTNVYAVATMGKEPLPSVAVPRNVSNDSQLDEAGYNGGGELDSDSDDDMLIMGGKK